MAREQPDEGRTKEPVVRRCVQPDEDGMKDAAVR